MQTATQRKVSIINGQSMAALRTKLGKNQTEFWQKIGVTQSGGSRYESGRSMPKPARIAAAHEYAEEIGRHARVMRKAV